MLVIDYLLLIVANADTVHKCPGQTVPTQLVGRLIAEAVVGCLVVDSHYVLAQ